MSDSGRVVRPSVFDLSSLSVDALTGGAPDRHGNKGPLLLLVKGLNCCEDLMIRSSIQGRRYYELFVSSFFFPLFPDLFRILTLQSLLVIQPIVLSACHSFLAASFGTFSSVVLLTFTVAHLFSPQTWGISWTM